MFAFTIILTFLLVSSELRTTTYFNKNYLLEKVSGSIVILISSTLPSLLISSYDLIGHPPIKTGGFQVTVKEVLVIFIT